MRRRLPIKVKLAVVSAALTFLILCLFAIVIGAVTEQRVRSNFDDDLRATAADLQENITLRDGPDGEPALGVRDLDAVRAAAAGDAAIRVVGRHGRLLISAGAPDLGRPIEGVTDVGDYRVATRPLFSAVPRRAAPFELLPGPVADPAAFVQYAKPQDSVANTITRVRLFLGFGVLGGTALAFLGGLLVAHRAMRPITGLTRAAREVARTRDPQVTLPKPEAKDEVADLADTLEDMLRELDAARAETEAALARQREFVADASHELRTPLTSILANLELLEAELQGDEREIAGSALRSSRRMRRLVADLLLLARADAGRHAPRRPVDLGAVAREAVAEAAPLASEHPVSLDLRDGVVVEGAPDDLHRMALNLIENAVVHTPHGTPVTVSSRVEDGHAVLEVADRGPGVPETLRGRVFERFSRGAGDSRPAGSGLGLAIVRAVAEAHGGAVALDEASGGGASFRVRLPASGRAPLRASAHRPGPVRRAPN
jgi:two-component system OmpR family sensor kinase